MQTLDYKVSLSRLGLLANNLIGIILILCSVPIYDHLPGPAFALATFFTVSIAVNVLAGALTIPSIYSKTKLGEYKTIGGPLLAMFDAALAIGFLILHVVNISMVDSFWQVRNNTPFMYGAFSGLVAR